MTTTWTNLDRIAASCSQKIVRDAKSVIEKKSELENLITKSLGVLQENGIYAMTLFLLSRNEKESKVTHKILKHLINLLFISEIRKMLKPDTSQPDSLQPDSVLPFVSDEICNDLDRLLLVKSLYEQVLIYARYGAKALEDKTIKEGETEV